MLSRKTNPLLLDESSHVLALISAGSLKPGHPEASVLFERAAELEHSTGCDVTIVHFARPASIQDNLREHLALRVLVKRANERFDADFDVLIRYGSRDSDDIRRLVTDKNGDLLLIDHTEAGTLEESEVMLLQQSSFPLWYVSKHGEIDEVSALLSGNEAIKANDQLTCTVAQHIGANLGSSVTYMQSEDIQNKEVTDAAGDLIVTYASGLPVMGDEQPEHRHAKELLESSDGFDLLVHRGIQGDELAHADQGPMSKAA